MTGITWQSWGGSTATGNGTLSARNCTPNCAEGKTSYYDATVIASGLVPFGSGEAYSLLQAAELDLSAAEPITDAIRPETR